jgi:hypothetical protein
VLVTEEYTDERRGSATSDVAGYLKGTSVLTMQNRVNLNNLTTIRSLRAGTLTARALETLRAAVQGVTLNRAMAPIFSAGQAPGGSPDLATLIDHDLPLMRRGVERC